MGLVEEYFGIQFPILQPHSLKRGTVSILKKLNLSVEDINLNVGWAIHSNSFATY
jgi:hypothetical protein